MKNNREGFSLIQVVIAMAMLGILSTVFASMMVSQQKQVSFLESKQEYVDIKNAVIRAFSVSPGYCAAANNNLSDITFTPSPLPTEINFNKVFDAPTQEYMRKTDGYIRGSNLLGVSNLRFINITGSGDSFSADLEIKTSQKKQGLVELKPILLTNVMIQTQTAPSNPSQKIIVGCTFGAEDELANQRAECVDLGYDNTGWGTYMCWEEGGNRISLKKTADGGNPDYGIGYNVKEFTQTIPIQIDSCISMHPDGTGHGTGLCWEKNGSRVVAMKTADAMSNPDFGIGATSFKKNTHNLTVPLRACFSSVRRDGNGNGTAMCREKGGDRIVFIKTADGGNPDYGIGVNFHYSIKNLNF